VYDTTNVITLNNAGVTDTVGTPGTGTTTSPNYQVGPAPNSAQLAPDPLHPGEMYLLVNGTSGNDVITVTRPTSTTYNVVINGVNKGTFTSPSGIVVYGQDGNDKITLASNVKLDSLLDGGNGADTINGGGSNSVMLGGSGNDTLTGFGALVGGADNDILKSSGGRSLMIGGAGADNLTSQFGNDILIGGTTNHDADPFALASLRAEWNLNTPVATRIAHLAGLAGGGLNGTYLLVSDAVRAGTVHNDFAVDKLSNNSSLDWILPFSGDLRSKIIGQVNHA
jgi:Ca2+-binding RTX toxin-like protein